MGRELRGHPVPPSPPFPDGEMDLPKVRPELSSMALIQGSFYSVLYLRDLEICLDWRWGWGTWRWVPIGFRDSLSHFLS